MNTWLESRSKMQLHQHQLRMLITLFIKFYRDFELQGIDNIKSDTYESVRKRLTVRWRCYGNGCELELEFELAELDLFPNSNLTRKTKTPQLDMEKSWFSFKVILNLTKIA